MSNGAQAAESSTYRVLRELGNRSQRAYAAMRVSGRDDSVVVLNRFMREVSGAGAKGVEPRFPAETVALLLRDARCLAKNWHPNIARVRHVDFAGDTLTIATELVDGVTLEELLVLAKQRRLHPEEPILSHAILARIFLDVLAGLQALHGLRDAIRTPLSAFHGELCPANVVVGKDGVARIVSVFRPRPVTITPRSEALGYAAPETLTAELQQDARADLWAVGVMLWEALTERRLYDEKHPARVAQRQREEDIPRPDARLADVAMRALSFDPLHRFRMAQDVAVNIRALAGTVASGSMVAQTVAELAGDAIRARRAELDPGVSRRHRPAEAPPSRTVSGPRRRALATTVQAPTQPEARPAASPAPKASFATMAAREMRVLTTSEPDIETSYRRSPLSARDRPLPARLPTDRLTPAPPASVVAPPALPPPLPRRSSAPSIAPDDDEDDDLPGPRQSTPECEYLSQLASIALGSKNAPDVLGDLLDADLVEDEETNALAAARDVIVSLRAQTPAPDRMPVQMLGPLPLVTTPPRRTPPPFFLPDPLAAACSVRQGPPDLPAPREPSTRTPFVIDALPSELLPTRSSPDRRRFLPLAAALAAAVLLVIGATILTRHPAPSPNAASAAPPAANDALPPRASATPGPSTSK